MAGRIGQALVKAGTLIGVGMVVGSNCLYNVEAGHRGMIFDRVRGVLDDVKDEGTHFLIPVLQRPIIMDVRTTPRLISTVTGTKDLQNVNLSLRVLYKPVTDELPELYNTLGLTYSDRVLPSIGNEVLKAVVARYNADQLLTLRGKISREVKEAMEKRCRNFHILLDDVSITHLTFSQDFARAIEDKQVAQQYSERAKFMVEKAEQDRQVSIIGAEADAEAAELVSNAIRQHGRGGIEVRRLETAVTIAETLAKARGGVTYMPDGQNMLLNVGSGGPRPRSS